MTQGAEVQTALTPLIDLELEQAALGQMIAHGTYPRYLSGGVSRSVFFREAHRFVFDAIAAVHARGAVADLPLVGHELRERGKLEEVGHAYYSALVDGVPRPLAENVSYTADMLLEIHGARAIDRAATSMRSRLRDPNLKRDDVIKDYLHELTQQHRRGVAPEALLDVDHQIQAYDTFLTKARDRGLWLGIPGLDESLSGLHAGDLFGVMARPGIGKTLLLCNLATYIAEFGVGHVFVSLEMPAAQIVERLMRITYELGRHQLIERQQAGTLDPEPYRQRFQHFVIVDRPGLSVREIEAAVEEAAVEQLQVPLEVVTIDHLGLIGGSRHTNRYERISTIAQDLQAMTKRLEVVALIANQVSREAGGDGSRELHLGSSRDSGVYEEVCYYLIGLRRLDRCLGLTQQQRFSYRDTVFARLLKNRHGELGGEVALHLDPKTLTMTQDNDTTITDADDKVSRARPR